MLGTAVEWGVIERCLIPACRALSVSPLVALRDL